MYNTTSYSLLKLRIFAIVYEDNITTTSAIAYNQIEQSVLKRHRITQYSRKQINDCTSCLFERTVVLKPPSHYIGMYIVTVGLTAIRPKH